MLLIIPGILLVFLLYSFLPTVLTRLAFRKIKKPHRQRKALFLTFDDGPHPEYTELLLDILKKHRVKASFFVVADFAQKNRDVIGKMIREGHTIGIHSEKHKSALLRSAFFLDRDFARSAAVMREFGQEAIYYRPPWGHLNLLTFLYLKKYGLKLVLWDVMAQDWSPTATAAGIEAKLLRRIQPGSVVCLHDGRGADGAPQRTIQALDSTIPLLQQAGYRFLRLEEGYA